MCILHGVVKINTPSCMENKVYAKQKRNNLVPRVSLESRLRGKCEYELTERSELANLSKFNFFNNLSALDNPQVMQRVKKIIKGKLPRFNTRFPILPLEKTYATNEENYYFDLETKAHSQSSYQYQLKS